MEGSALKCIRRGKEEGSGYRITKVFKAVSNFHGTVLFEQNEDQLTEQIFADFVREHFENTKLALAAFYEKNYFHKMVTPVRVS